MRLGSCEHLAVRIRKELSLKGVVFSVYRVDDGRMSGHIRRPILGFVLSDWFCGLCMEIYRIKRNPWVLYWIGLKTNGTVTVIAASLELLI